MFKKNPDLVIQAKKPFDADKLDRQPSIEMLTKLVQSTEQPFVLSVEAPWGFGKTTFIDLWKLYLEGQGHLCLHFNAWKNDFVEDPMVAFLGEMNRAIEKSKIDDEAFPLASDWEKVKILGGRIIRKALPVAVQIVTRGALKSEEVEKISASLSENADKIAESASEFAKKKLEEYESSVESIEGFKKALAALAEHISKAGDNKKPIVFFIDELDRCRPDFAVALLERVKHLFQVTGFFFVLAMHREQLVCSIKCLYGQDMNADEYLRRFVDLRYRLPDPPSQKFPEFLVERFKMDEVFKKFGGPESGRRLLIDLTADLAAHFRLSLRAQEQCFTEINMVLRTSGDPDADEIAPAVFFTFLRAADPKAYASIIEGKADPRKMRSLVPNDSWWPPFAEAITILACPSAKRKDELFRNLKLRAGEKYEAMPGEPKAFDTWESYCQFQRALPVGFRTVIERLELLPHARTLLDE